MTGGTVGAVAPTDEKRVLAAELEWCACAGRGGGRRAFRSARLRAL